MIRNEKFFGAVVILTLAIAVLIFRGYGGFVKNMRNQPTSIIDSKPAYIILQMSHTEKGGLMTQITLAVISKDPLETPIMFHEICSLKLKGAILKYQVGSILKVVNHAYGSEQWYQLQKQIKDVASRTRLKILILYGIDATPWNKLYAEGNFVFPGNRDGHRLESGFDGKGHLPIPCFFNNQKFL